MSQFFSQHHDHRCDHPRELAEEDLGRYWACGICESVWQVSFNQGWVKMWQPDFNSPKVTVDRVKHPGGQTDTIIVRERDVATYQSPYVHYTYVEGGIVGKKYLNSMVPWENAPKPDDYDEWVGQSRPREPKWYDS